MIGDREHDIIGAKENGLYGFGVLWGYGTKDELEASGAHAFIKNPSRIDYRIQRKVEPATVLDSQSGTAVLN